ncbi:unnamed protein product (macronuclear) [Paramecium tetraurelia]|uniref:RNA helicase n=1 Tax=Paramecium tetraurelia TaxID=5888 RepID=A0EA02_PARTE|nr:uncharacterized protein GSPATT00024850001 [Paramecium tetraurelia]CAK92119.1 unnamed protein product [Paramecium tetraurelia]|eukprot:XP_001459516.1 hypothetical protein (macronuclear) [Paramecium tetraurelia strain d4-2]
MKGLKRWSQPLGMFASCPGEFENFTKCFIDASNLQYSQEDIEKFRTDNNITIVRDGEQDNDIIQPFLDWKHFPLGPPEFQQPTAIQSEVIPIVLSGRNALAIAQTGSGKTLAYLLPALVHLEQHAMIMESPQPKLLILVPTRELGVQIYDQLLQLIEFYYGNKKQNEKENSPNLTNLKIVCIYGGNPNKKQQVELIQKGIHVIVATPGRLIELIDEGMVNLNKITMLILDEADRMLDMGFEPQVRDIVSTIREDRQTILLSATWPNEVQQLSKEFCYDPILVKIGKGAPITQKIICTGQKEKLHVLMNVLDDLIYTDKVLIFAETKKRCEDLSQSLTKQGYFCISLHGDKSQDQRDAIMKQFKDSNTRLICATDIASRGLDVKDITVVVNYDFPKSFDDYIHRIGRTGRAGAHGRSFSLLSYEKDEGILADQVITYLNSCNQEVNQELLEFKDKALKVKQERQQRKLQQYIDNSNQTGIPNSIYPPNNFCQTSENKQENSNQWEGRQQYINQGSNQKKPYHKHSRSEYNEEYKGEIQQYQQHHQRNYNMDFKNKQQQDRQPQQQFQQQQKKNQGDSRQVNVRNRFQDAEQPKILELNQELDLKNYKLLPQFQEEDKTNSFSNKRFNDQDQNQNQKTYNMDFRSENDNQNRRNNNNTQNHNNNHEAQFYNDKYLNHLKNDKTYNNDRNYNNHQRNYDKNFNNHNDRQNNNNNFDRNNNERITFDRSNNERNYVDKSNNERNFVDKAHNNNERNFVDKHNNERNYVDKHNNERNFVDRPNNERNFVDKPNNDRNFVDRSNNERQNERNNNERYNDRNNNERFTNEKNNNERYNNERFNNERNFKVNNNERNFNNNGDKNFSNQNNFDRNNNERNFNNQQSRNFTGGNDKSFNERVFAGNDKYQNNKQINSMQNDRQFNSQKNNGNDQNYENDQKISSKQYQGFSKSDFTKYQNMKGQQK